jgi:hypothetical protein
MRFITRLAALSLADLKALAAGQLHFPVSDLEFFETLAAHKCLVVTPWVVRFHRDGQMQRVTPILFDADGNIDKVKTLIGVARAVRQAKRERPDFGPRFSQEG